MQRVNLLVHSTGEVVLGQFATRLVVGASVELDALQISRDNVLAFSCIIQNRSQSTVSADLAGALDSAIGCKSVYLHDRGESYRARA